MQISKLYTFAKVLVSGLRKQKPLFALGLLLVVLSPFSAVSQTDSLSIKKEKKVDTRMPLKKRDTLDKSMPLKESNVDTTTKTEQPHSPRKATYYSMALPGLGQAYNKKYWKIPIVYAGFGTLGYFIKKNTDDYRTFKAAYTYVLEEDEGPPPNEMVERYNNDINKLRTIKDYYRRNLELSYILTGALYILQVLDATVDAHFVDFDVSKDLSIEVDPFIMPDPLRPMHASKGLTIRLKL